MANEKNIHILLIGPVTNVQAKLVGGATISFGYLIDYLEREKASFTLVNTKRYFGWKKILNPFYVLLKVLLSVISADVIFLNSSQGGTKFLAPLLFILTKLFRNKFVFRPFGGNIKDYTQSYNSIQKWIFNHTILKSDIFFLQTNELMEHYKNENVHTVQLPTSRDEPEKNLLRGDNPFQKRFVYLGFVNSAKGMDQLLEARQLLGTEYTIHVYGPIMDETYNRKFEIQKGVYKGILKKEEVLRTIRDYDVLVLPTFYEGEGYPGAIIEAYSLGLPVITTNWKAIPEIVVQNETGLLIEPQSTEVLVTAIEHFDASNYSQYSSHAYAYFMDKFNSRKVTGQAIEQIRKLFI